MYLLGQTALGVVILLLLALLVVVKQIATGSVLERPGGSLLVQLVNVYNLFFLLVVNPLAAVLLLTRGLTSTDPTHVVIDDPRASMPLEVVGLALYALGFALMAWALITLGRNYQLGGSAPRSDDRIVTAGPYGRVRHPMYTAALSICLGLACLIHSPALVLVFVVYLALILRLIPTEEAGLRKAYGEDYVAYEKKASRLLPFVY